MNRNGKLYMIHCVSPVHIGAGQGVGDIDLPIMRERTTEWPYIPGSSVKGVQRRLYHRLSEGGQDLSVNREWVYAVFGRAEREAAGRIADATGESTEPIAGALVLTDSRLLAFPVISYHGVFAYVTSPLALRRMDRDCRNAGIAAPPLDIGKWEQKLEKDRQSAWICRNSLLTGDNHTGDGTGETRGAGGNAPGVPHSAGTKRTLERASAERGKVRLDEFEFSAELDGSLHRWAEWCAQRLFPGTGSEAEEEQASWRRRLVVVSDDAFQYFVTMCCEVTPRIRIRESVKTVEQGALWYEEYLPAESVLYGLAWCDNLYHPHLKGGARDIWSRLRTYAELQLGGNTSVGKGRVRCLLSEGEGER